MDTLGLILTVVVHAADVQDYDGIKLVFESIRGRFSKLKLVWADGMYERMKDWVFNWRRAYPIRLEVVKRDGPGFKVLPRRWVVERTFARPLHSHRLARACERLTSKDEALIYATMSG